MSKACVQRLELISVENITAAPTKVFVDTPHDVADFYLKLDATEDVAGGITVTVNTNESESATDEAVVHTFGALSATGVTKVLSGSASGQSLLGPQLSVDLSSITGTWDITVELWYSKTNE